MSWPERGLAIKNYQKRRQSRFLQNWPKAKDGLVCDARSRNEAGTTRERLLASCHRFWKAVTSTQVEEMTAMPFPGTPFGNHNQRYA